MYGSILDVHLYLNVTKCHFTGVVMLKLVYAYFWMPYRVRCLDHIFMVRELFFGVYGIRFFSD